MLNKDYKVINGFEEYMIKNGINDINDIVGKINV